MLIFNTLCIVTFRLFIHLEEEPWFLYIFLAAFNILYLFNNLEFWGLVALLFDVRQGKRLFAIVSAWDGPARLIGYGIAFVFSAISGTENLLWIAAFFMLISILLFIPLTRWKEMQNLVPTHHHHFATQSMQNVQAAITGNKLIRNAALVSFFSFCFYLITNFVLYGYIKKAFHTDESLAEFFSIFLVISRGLALIIKPLFINRLLDRIGLRRSLLIAPFSLLMLCCASLFLSGIHTSKTGFYLFMVMAVAVDILRSSVLSPVLLVTLQPLPAQQRLRGHTIIKGFMDPFAFLVTGILLLLTHSSAKETNLSLLSGILFIITLLWMFFSFSIDGNYIKTLAAAIRKRTLNDRDLVLTDSDSLDFLLNRIDKGSEEEVISILQLLSSQHIDQEKFYLRALRHNSPRIRRYALEFIRAKPDPALIPELKKMLNEEQDPANLSQIIRTIATLDKNEDLSVYLKHENPDLTDAAVMGLLFHDDHAGKTQAEQHIIKLLGADHFQDRVHALQMVGELKAVQFSDYVLNLIDNENETVRQEAVRTAGKLADEGLASRLLDIYLHTDGGKDAAILKSLQEAGEPAVLSIRQFLQSRQCSKAKRHRLFAALGKINGQSALTLLEECLKQFPEDRETIFSILYHRHFKCNGNAGLYEDFITQALDAASADLSILQTLQPEPEKNAMVIHALQLELDAIKDKCLWLFSFLYDSEKIRKARTGFELNTRESVANAFELIDMEVHKKYSAPFIALFENTDPVDKSHQLQKFFKLPSMTVSTAIKNMLVYQADLYNDWTKACCLYAFRNEPGLLDMEMIKPYLSSEHPIIKETAWFISNRQAGQEKMAGIKN